MPNVVNTSLLRYGERGSLLGMVGLIIALPMTTLIISYYKRFVLTETKTEEIKKVVIIKKTEEVD